jgi:signal peptidase I
MRMNGKMRGIFMEALGAVVVGVVLFIIFNLTLQYSIVQMSSMEPNLHEGQRLLLSKVAYAFGEPQRGDIVIFPPPGIESKYDYIKRVIGLPGDTVEVIDGTVYVNDMPLEEPYITNPGNGFMAKITVPEGEYFVMGDNRNNSTDSRSFGTVPGDTIVGKAWLSIWPISDWGTAPNYDLSEQLELTGICTPAELAA